MIKELTRTCRVLLQALFNSCISIDDSMITINATISSNSISWSSTTITRLMTIKTDSIFRIFRERTFWYTELSIFNICTFITIISIWSTTRSFTLWMTISTSFLVNLINSAMRLKSLIL